MNKERIMDSLNYYLRDVSVLLEVIEDEQDQLTYQEVIEMINEHLKLQHLYNDADYLISRQLCSLIKELFEI